ncbi:TetR/AcrR family transcriptional regulator [Hydrogenophaga sp. PAMC20947]|uniref:TetR/AcrR family transcriptional regulator n=1 Tax=Hydrogenophaga sp. PAMC20947 TaxID=2565558 RepID=UPI00144649A3|nr:TetR/AcrR family transcriptional regulator [Hydrogenophaga sp. PAMC20947]
MKFDAISPQPPRDEERRALALRQGRRERQARAAQVRRGQLLEVAWQLLQEQGPARFNMRELGLRAGYTAGAMYGYFASREHILLALRQRWVDEVAIAVAQAKLPRRLRRSASATPSTRLATSQELDTDAAADARERFLVRSEVWWRSLTREAFAIPLLLLPGPLREVRETADAMDEGRGEAVQGAWMPLDALEHATRACVDDLEAAGWAPDRARGLQREALCLGFGLATLGSLSGHGGDRAGAPSAVNGFRITLERWLAHGVALPSAQAPLQAAGQPDLFAR